MGTLVSEKLFLKKTKLAPCPLCTALFVSRRRSSKASKVPRVKRSALLRVVIPSLPFGRRSSKHVRLNALKNLCVNGSMHSQNQQELNFYLQWKAVDKII